MNSKKKVYNHVDFIDFGHTIDSLKYFELINKIQSVLNIDLQSATGSCWK